MSYSSKVLTAIEGVNTVETEAWKVASILDIPQVIQIPFYHISQMLA